MTPPCKGQRFGHRFGYPGGPCLYGCGITQAELSGMRLREVFPKAITEKDIEPKK